jgi:hypothetical protein
MRLRSAWRRETPNSKTRHSATLTAEPAERNSRSSAVKEFIQPGGAATLPGLVAATEDTLITEPRLRLTMPASAAWVSLMVAITWSRCMFLALQPAGEKPAQRPEPGVVHQHGQAPGGPEAFRQRAGHPRTGPRPHLGSPFSSAATCSSGRGGAPPAATDSRAPLWAKWRRCRSKPVTTARPGPPHGQRGTCTAMHPPIVFQRTLRQESAKRSTRFSELRASLVLLGDGPKHQEAEVRLPCPASPCSAAPRCSPDDRPGSPRSYGKRVCGTVDLARSVVATGRSIHHQVEVVKAAASCRPSTTWGMWCARQVICELDKNDLPRLREAQSPVGGRGSH